MNAKRQKKLMTVFLAGAMTLGAGISAQAEAAPAERLAEDLKDVAVIESPPKMEGRNMHMLIAPLPSSSKKKKQQQQEKKA